MEKALCFRNSNIWNGFLMTDGRDPTIAALIHDCRCRFGTVIALMSVCHPGVPSLMEGKGSLGMFFSSLTCVLIPPSSISGGQFNQISRNNNVFEANQ